MNAQGFSLVEILVIMSVFTIIAAMAVPLYKDSADAMTLGTETRKVERVLQDARLKAVKANQPMRVRFNCPAAGQYRMVELIGTPTAPATADSATDRCDQSVYPYCPPGSTASPCDASIITRPNHDGPVQLLESQTTFSLSQTLEFWSDGTVHVASGTIQPWPTITGTGVTLTLSRKAKTKSIVVNGFGKTLIQ